MLRFSLRELIIGAAAIVLASVIAVDRYRQWGQHQMSETELAVYAAAIRHTLTIKDINGVLFLEVAGADPPTELGGAVFLPASRAAMSSEVDRRSELFDRICDSVSGQPGTVISVRIVKWVSKDRVIVDCRSSSGAQWGGGAQVYLRLTNGAWHFEEEVPDTGWDS